MSEKIPENWKTYHSEEVGHHWLRSDCAVVRKSEGYSSKFWLPNFRAFLAYAPGEDFALSNRRKNSQLKFVRYFKTAENAMKALDREFPCVAAPLTPSEDAK